MTDALDQGGGHLICTHCRQVGRMGDPGWAVMAMHLSMLDGDAQAPRACTDVLCPDCAGEAASLLTDAEGGDGVAEG
jgi:hypothetical protein